MDLWVTFIGTAASVPTAGRGTAATLVVRGGSRVLIDCGEGTQRQFLRSGLGLVDLDAILLTHLHGDHYLGLPGLLKTYALRGRTEPLPLIGPPGLASLLGALSGVIGRLPFALEVGEVGPGTVLVLDGARWDAFATRHSIRSLGYVLVEDARPGMFDVAAARALGVTPGPLFGRLQHGETITGIPSMFGRALTGPYGSVGWLTGYESLAQMEKANDAQAADPTMLKLIDSTQGCFVEDVGATQTTLYRKLA